MSDDPTRPDLFPDPTPDPIPAPLPADYLLPPEWADTEPEEACPAYARPSARWQESAFVVRPPKGLSWNRDSCVELARFHVPAGCTGVIQRIGIGLEIKGADPQNDPNIAVNYSYNPFAFATGATGTPVGVLFHLRLEPLSPSEALALGQVVTDQNHLPGLAHPELGSWGDSRYWWGNWVTTRLRVPEGRYCSLWVANPPGDIILNLTAWAGLLAGHTWNYRKNEAARIGAETSGL